MLVPEGMTKCAKMKGGESLGFAEEQELDQSFPCSPSGFFTRVNAY